MAFHLLIEFHYLQNYIYIYFLYPSKKSHPRIFLLILFVILLYILYVICYIFVICYCYF